MVIAIDGPAGAGKSTIAKEVARKKGFLYINSGHFYRAITWKVLYEKLDPKDKKNVFKIAQNIDFTFSHGRLHIDSIDVEYKLHSDEVDYWVAHHSSLPEVRNIVTEKLRNAASDFNIVMEGRDITTVVFPDADIKIYLDATIHSRAKRRYEQQVSNLSLEKIEKTLKQRDEIDQKKTIGSLKIAPDAIYFDTSDLTIKEVCEKVLSTIQRTLEHRE